MTCASRPPAWANSTGMLGVKKGFDKPKKIRELFWSGRPDLNRGPPAPKSGVLPLGSPSFSLDHLKEKDLAEEFGSGTMCENVAPHAWSPPTFPHSDKEAKVRHASRKGTLC